MESTEKETCSWPGCDRLATTTYWRVEGHPVPEVQVAYEIRMPVCDEHFEQTTRGDSPIPATMPGTDTPMGQTPPPPVDRSMTPEEMAAPPPGPDQWNEWAETDRRARELAPSLMGLSVEEANAVVAEHDGLTLRLLPADGQVIITAEHLIGRISGFVRDGMIVRVNTG